VNTESPRRKPSTESESARRRTWAVASTAFVTKGTQVAGVVLAILEWARPGEVQDSVLMFCAILVIGAEAMERILFGAIERVFGRETGQ
jgi:DMSO reductase anchor subunit